MGTPGSTRSARYYDWILLVIIVAQVITLVGYALLGGEQLLWDVYFDAVGVLGVVAVVRLLTDILRKDVGRGRTNMSVFAVELAAVLPFFLPLWLEHESHVHDSLDLGICAVSFVFFVTAVYVCARTVFTNLTLTTSVLKSALVGLVPVIGLVQFWYTGSYKPSHERPDVNITASLTKVAVGRGTTSLRADVTLSNDGSTDVDMFDAVYTVTGFDTAPLTAALTRSEFERPMRVAFADTSSRYVGVLRIGRLIAPGGHLAPGQHLQTSFVFTVRDATANAVRLTTLLSTLVVGDSQKLDAAAPCDAHVKQPSTCEIVDIPVQGWLSRQLGDDPRARTIMVEPRNKVPYLDTRFLYADDNPGQSKFSTARADFPFWNSRQFTTSVEYALPR